MDRMQALENESRVLRWGGLAGVAGGLLFILVFVIVGAFVPAYAAEPAAAVKWFPDIRLVRMIENGLYLVVLVLWVAQLSRGVSRAARTSLAPALFGGALGVAGLCPARGGRSSARRDHPALRPLPRARGDLRRPGDPPHSLWQASAGPARRPALAGLGVLSTGLVVLGAAMAGARAFGRRLGGFAVGLGLIGVTASIVALVDPRSPAPALGMFALIAFHLGSSAGGQSRCRGAVGASKAWATTASPARGQRHVIESVG